MSTCCDAAQANTAGEEGERSEPAAPNEGNRGARITALATSPDGSFWFALADVRGRSAALGRCTCFAGVVLSTRGVHVCVPINVCLQ